MTNTCQHGSLKRQCPICERDEEIVEANALLRKALDALVGSQENPNWEDGHDDVLAAIEAIRKYLGEE